MKKDEIILGACVYALIITAGFWGPKMKKLDLGHWIKTIDLLADENYVSLVPVARSKVEPQAFGLPALKIKGAENPVGRLPTKPLASGMEPPFPQNRVVKKGNMAYLLKLKGAEPGFPKNTPINVGVNQL